MFDRRDFLRLGAALSASALLPRVARADGTARNLVVVFAYGGWDTTYLFDPKPGVPEVDQAPGSWRDYGALSLWDPGGQRSDLQDFLTQHADRIAVVNGVAVRSLVHEACLQKVLTGAIGLDHPPDIGARVANALGSALPLPYLRVGTGARPQELASQSGELGYTNQLSSLVVPELAFPSGTPPFRAEASVESAVDAYLTASHASLAARRPGTGGSQRKLDDWMDAHHRASSIREHAREGFLSDVAAFYDYDPFPKAAAALSEGFSRAVFVQDPAFWDTHSFNAYQRPLFHDLFASLGQLLTQLEDAGVGDETLVLVLSEMGRSPLLNSEAGKDHWPFTSAMLIGAGVRSTVVRGTDDILVQQPVDFATGEADSGGRRVEAADVLATTCHLLGLDARALYPDAEVLRALVA